MKALACKVRAGELEFCLAYFICWRELKIPYPFSGSNALSNILSQPLLSKLYVVDFTIYLA